jgi:hypothetical protein
MKPEQTTDTDGRLRQVLRQWEVAEPLPPRFAEQVWHRIAREEARSPVSLWSRLTNWVVQSMSRPRLAASYLTVLVAAGLAAGYWRAQVEKAHTTEELGVRYVQMMDPYLMTASSR